MEPQTDSLREETPPDSEEDQIDGRRLGRDRRQRPTPMLSRYSFFGGRREGSRRGDEVHYYIDRYSRYLWTILIAVVGLSCLDALFTLHIVNSLGGSEVNPVMDLALQIGVGPFLLAKIVLTAIGVIVLCLHKNFPGVSWALGALLFMYIGLGCYHLYLLDKAWS